MMNKVLRFTRLDIITIKPYLTWKVLLLFLAVCALVAYGTGETSIIIGMCMMYGVIFASYPFAVGEKNALDTLYLTLPISKKHIVAGRYLFSVFLNLGALILSCLLSFIMVNILKREFDWIVNLVSILVCFVLLSLIEAIQIPIYYKFGYTKAKILTYLPLIALPATTLIVSAIAGENNLLPILADAMGWLESNMILALLLSVIIWAGIMLLSAVISYRFYKKREF
jgi:hypothetical protein